VEELRLPRQALLLIQYVGGVISLEGTQAPVFDLADVRHHRVQQVAVVRDEHHRAGVALDETLEEELALQVEVIVGFVQQQHIGARQQLLRQPHQLLLPAAQHAHGFTLPGALQAQPAQHLARAPGELLAPQRGELAQQRLLLLQRARQLLFVAVDTGVSQTGFHRLQLALHHRVTRNARQSQFKSAAGGVQLRFLRQAAHAHAARLRHGSARLWCELTRDQLEERGLARPVGSDQPDLLVVLHLPVQVGENGARAQHQRDVGKTDGDHACILPDRARVLWHIMGVKRKQDAH